jgi:transcription-repair coupling factor (superfamily II helicase)
MNLSALTRTLERSDQFQRALRDVRRTTGISLSVADSAKPFMTAALHAALDIPMALVAARPTQARRYLDDLAAWHPRPNSIIHFPVPDALPYEHLAYDPELTSSRMQALRALTSRNSAPLIVLAARSALDCLVEPTKFSAAASDGRVARAWL